MICKDAHTDRNQATGIIGSTDLQLTVSNLLFVRMDISTTLHAAIAMRDIHTLCSFCDGYRQRTASLGALAIWLVLSAYPRKKTVIILFCLLPTASQWHNAARKETFSKFPDSGSLGTSARQSKQPVKPTNTSTFSWESLRGDRLHTIPFVNSRVFKEQKHGKDAETQGFTSSLLLLLLLLPSPPPHAGQAAAQEGWHRNACSRLCWLEYQWRPAMSLTANRKEEKETLPQKKQIAGDELSQQVPCCNSELLVSESRYRRLL